MFNQCTAQRGVRSLLFAGTQGCDDVQSGGVGQLTILRVNLLAYHFGGIFGVYFNFAGFA